MTISILCAILIVTVVTTAQRIAAERRHLNETRRVRLLMRSLRQNRPL